MKPSEAVLSVTLAFGVLAAPLVAGAQQARKIPRIGYLSTVVHKFGNVFRYAARGRAGGAASSFFSRSVRSSRVKCHANGRAMVW